jgi:hypothetical protein
VGALERELAELGVDELVFQTVGIDLAEDRAVAHCEAIIRTLGTPAAVAA